MERRAVVIRGIVQGVGFRPFVHGQAARRGLGGFVRNQSGLVAIEVEGDPKALDSFLADLVAEAPPLARVENVSWEPCPLRGERHFRIEASSTGTSGEVFVSPDVAPCAACLGELFDPTDRRFGYPLLNCTNCGPRLTIITSAPYDRARTTMAAFALCPACRAEYDDPTDRRFHAQPTACADCGPRLALGDARGERVSSAHPLDDFVALLRSGKIGALKGLGGYHLTCDATNAEAVSALRRRKHREDKPFAIMVPDVAAAEERGTVSAAERILLESPARPIVLLRRRPGAVADAVAPNNPWLGVMLPSTPLHHLLLRALKATPLVMTSGNRCDEPIAYRDDDAVSQLSGIADVYLTHDRPIHVRCDDSVTRVLDGVELPLRRSRGYAPRPVDLPFACPRPLLAVGGQLKGTFAFGRGRQAFLSHHLGDHAHYEAYKAFVRDLDLYERLFGVRPEGLVCDLHPDYAATRYAHERAARESIPLLKVQHHHAHMASCLAEHGVTGPAIGVTFDGTGYGLDGAVWGGEFLVGDCRQVRRAAHLRYVGLPGGDKAAREPWRMAIAHLADAETTCATLTRRLSSGEEATIRRMVATGFNTPRTSSVGRLFDAVASLAGVRDRTTFEGQAAVALEALALDAEPDGSYPFEVETPPAGPLLLDTRPLIAAVAHEADRGVSTGRIARRFHATIVEMIAATCARIRGTTGIEAVALSGGVFLNVILTRETIVRLERDGFRVYRHRLVPPNDGGLCLGQLAIAAAGWEETTDVPRDSR